MDLTTLYDTNRCTCSSLIYRNILLYNLEAYIKHRMWIHESMLCHKCFQLHLQKRLLLVTKIKTKLMCDTGGTNVIQIEVQ